MRDRKDCGNTLWAVVAAFLVFLVIAAGAGLWFVTRVAKTVKVTEGEHGGKKEVRIDSSIGSVRVGASDKFKPEDAGIPVYPGAKPLKDEDNSQVSVSLGTAEKKVGLEIAAFQTSDSVEKVRDYYKKKLPAFLVTPRGFEMNEKGEKKIVVIEDKNGETKIVIVAATSGDAAN